MGSRSWCIIGADVAEMSLQYFAHIAVDLRISHLEKSIAEQRKEAKKSEKDFQKTEADRAKLKAAIEDLRTRLKGLDYDPV